MEVFKNIANLSVAIFSVLFVLGFFGVIFFGLYKVTIGTPTIEKDITVINKTIETVGLATDYLILANDGNVYRTRDWKIFYNIKVGKRYNIKTKHVHRLEYPSDYWTIEDIEER